MVRTVAPRLGSSWGNCRIRLAPAAAPIVEDIIALTRQEVWRRKRLGSVLPPPAAGVLHHDHPERWSLTIRLASKHDPSRQCDWSVMCRSARRVPNDPLAGHYRAESLSVHIVLPWHLPP